MTHLRDREAIGRLLQPELQLVYATAVSAPGAEHVAALLTQALDWPLVAALADRERATPSVLAAVQRHRPELLRLPALEPLKRLGLIAAFESVRLEGKLAKTLDALAPAGIVPVLLKGAGAALQRRGTLRGRPMRDLDLLIEPSQLTEALALARTAGWGVSRHAAADAFYEVAAHIAPLEDEGGSQLQLELHGDLFFHAHPFGLTGQLVRERALPLTWQGRHLRVPDTTSLILHTALHGAWSHGLSGAWWRSIHDIAPVLPADERSWEALVQAAESARASTSLYWLLRVGRALSELPVPEPVLGQLGRRIPRLLRSPLFAHVVGDACQLTRQSPSVKLNRLAWHAALQPKASGHGSHTPWQHENLLGFVSGTAEVPQQKLHRHLRDWRRYWMYGRRLLLR